MQRNFSRDKRRIEEMKKKRHEEKKLKKLNRATAIVETPPVSPEGLAPSTELTG